MESTMARLSSIGLSKGSLLTYSVALLECRKDYTNSKDVFSTTILTKLDGEFNLINSVYELINNWKNIEMIKKLVCTDNYYQTPERFTLDTAPLQYIVKEWIRKMNSTFDKLTNVITSEPKNHHLKFYQSFKTLYDQIGEDFYDPFMNAIDEAKQIQRQQKISQQNDKNNGQKVYVKKYVKKNKDDNENNNPPNRPRPKIYKLKTQNCAIANNDIINQEIIQHDTI